MTRRILISITLCISALLAVPVAFAQKSMLVYGPTAGGLGDSTPGFTVTTWTAATWATKTTADFMAFDVIVFNDQPACYTDTTQLNCAVTTRSTWLPAVTGNVVLIGSDIDFHSKMDIAHQLVAFAGDDPKPGPGLYYALSCVYTDMPVVVPLWMTQGTWPISIIGTTGLGDQIHKIANHPALNGVTDADLSNWEIAVHEGFTTWPPEFQPLAIAMDAPSRPYTAVDGTVGLPYILVKGDLVEPIPTMTRTPTKTPSPTQTRTATATATITSTSTITATQSATPTITSTSTITLTDTSTPTQSATPSLTMSSTPTDTLTTTTTFTPTITRTPTSTGSMTPTPSETSTPTWSSTPTETISPTRSATPTSSPTAATTPSATPTPTSTSTNTPTQSSTPSLTRSSTPSETLSHTPTHSMTWTITITSTPTWTPTPIQSMTWMITPTQTPQTGGERGACSLHVWPNPFDPSRSVRGTFKVGCLPIGAVVSFYTVSGEKVRALQNTDQQVEWDGTNDHRLAVSGGTYYWMVKYNGQNLGQGMVILTRP